MSEFYAVYLFMVISGVLLVVGLWKRIWIFFMFSGISAIFAGLYFVFWTTTPSAFVEFLGVFCILGGLTIFFSMFSVMPKKLDEPEEERNYDKHLSDAIDETSTLYKRTHKRRWDE